MTTPGSRTAGLADASPDEVAAVLAAIDAVWPRPQVAGTPETGSRWRFSGRWWSKPVPVRRDRPW